MNLHASILLILFNFKRTAAYLSPEYGKHEEVNIFKMKALLKFIGLRINIGFNKAKMKGVHDGGLFG